VSLIISKLISIVIVMVPLSLSSRLSKKLCGSGMEKCGKFSEN